MRTLVEGESDDETVKAWFDKEIFPKG
jgi:hypothetical protein